DGHVRVWDGVSGQHKAQGLAQAQGLAFAPDGRRLVVALKGKAVVWEPGRDQGVVPLEGGAVSGGRVAFCLGGTQVVLVPGEDLTRVWLCDAGTGKEKQRFNQEKDPIGAIAVSPDGRQIACAHHSNIWFLDAVTGKVLRMLTENPANWSQSLTAV